MSKVFERKASSSPYPAIPCSINSIYSSHKQLIHNLSTAPLPKKQFSPKIQPLSPPPTPWFSTSLTAPLPHHNLCYSFIIPLRFHFYSTTIPSLQLTSSSIIKLLLSDKLGSPHSDCQAYTIGLSSIHHWTMNHGEADRPNLRGKKIWHLNHWLSIPICPIFVHYRARARNARYII